MKLHEAILLISHDKRIKRHGWNFYLVWSADSEPLVKIDLFSIEIERYMLLYEDLVADDWETF
jgi:hypothetical protein